MDLTKPINLSNLSLALAKVKSDYEAKIKSVPVSQIYTFYCWKNEVDGVIEAPTGSFRKIQHTEYDIVTTAYGGYTYYLLGIGSDRIDFATTTSDGAIQILKLHDDNTVTVETVGQSDWNENDPEASGYIKNRVCYTGDPVTTEVYNGTVNFEGNSYKEVNYSEGSENSFSDGQKYTIVFNGTTYTGNALVTDGQARMGNLSIYDAEQSDTGEPFVLDIDNMWFYISLKEASTEDIPISITIDVPNVYKLDDKYLNGSLLKRGNGGNSVLLNGVNSDLVADGLNSVAEGSGTQSLGSSSHAEGMLTTASGYSAHSEGANTKSSGESSHAEGFLTKATGNYSHTEGSNTEASGEASHAEGWQTKATHAYQHVFGSYNVADPSTNASTERGTYIEIVGKGTGANISTGRSNARTLDWSGNEVLAGKLTVGKAPENDMDVATKKYVDEKGTYDTEPIQGSTNPITSGAVYTEKQSLQVLISDKAPMSHTHSVYLHVNDDGSSYFDVDVATQTKEAYNELMDRWFVSQGAKTATSEELTALCDEWYTISRNGWDGWTTFAQPEVSTVSTGVKGGDNAGMVCIPSTELVANQDDYAGIPQFAIRDCNWHMSDDGDIIIDAIEGISDNFERSNPEKYVGVLQMTMMHYWYEDEESYTHGLTDDLSDTSHENQSPYPEAIKLDGTVRSWVCHGKYMSSTVDGKMTCCSGLIPTGNMSHNNAITLKNKNGSVYSGGCITDWSFLILMTYIKYASLTQDGIIQGNVGYNYSNKALVEESGVNRALLAQAQSANYIVGSTINIGTSNRSVSQPSRIVTAVEDIVVDDTTYAAIYFDGDPLDITTSTYIAAYHWINGWNDTVLGNDGSRGNPSNGKYPAMIQGIEYSVGGYDVCTDVFLNLDGTNMKTYVCKDATKQTSGATTSTSGYTARDASIALPASNGWQYVTKLTYDKDIFFASSISGGSSTTYTRDAWYVLKSGTSGTKEFLPFGYLTNGSATGGLSFLSGSYDLGSSRWFFLARLSCNGNRGELTA